MTSGWRYWRQKRLERELREVYSDDWNSVRLEIAEIRRQKLVPPEIKHFKALDRVRVKEIEELKAEIARLEELLRQAGLQYWEPVEILVTGSMERF